MTIDNASEIKRRIAGLSPEQKIVFEKAMKAHGLDGALPLAARPRNPDGEPLSFGQERLWFLSLWDRNSTAYTIPAAIRLKGDLDETAFAKSLLEIARRHEILRMTFSVRDNRPIQSAGAEPGLLLRHADLRNLPPAERAPETIRRTADEINRPFDLTTGPLIRALLLRTDDDERVLVITAHHIVFDGWSTGVFIRELAAVYQAFAQQTPLVLPPLTVQYADYAVWQRERLSGGTLNSLLDYWTKQLDGAPPLLALPTDRPRPAAQTYNGDTIRFDFGEALSASLRQLCRNSGATLFMALVAGYAALLARWSGQTDLVIGSPVANRNRREIESLIGFFVNTLALRVDLDGDPSFADLLARVRQTALDAYARQDMPFEKLVEALKPERSMSYPPIFQVMLVLQNIPIEPLELPGLNVMPMEIDTHSAKFDICLSVENTGTDLRGILEFSTDLFMRETLARFVESFRCLLAAAAANPALRLSELPIMTAQERERWLTTYRRASSRRHADTPVHRLFEEQTARTPNTPALMCDGSPLSFTALNSAANRIAHALRQAGVAPECAVGLLLERSPEMVAAILGVLKSGAAFVPLDPAYPPDRLAFIAADAGMHTLISRSALIEPLASSVSDARIRTLFLDRDRALLSSLPESDPEPRIDPAHCAYIIYTSGSTGRPKGVMIQHGALAAHCRDMQALYGLTAEDHELLFSSFCFDASIEQMFPVMTAGGASVLRGDALWPPYDVLRQCATAGVTIVHMIPAYLQQVLQACAVTPEMADGTRIRLLIAGGDVVQPELVRLWRDGPLHTARLLNEYGPTETTITATIYDFPREPADTTGAVSIGLPRSHAMAVVVDSRLNPVPQNFPGELLIGGGCLARGYLAKPDLTAERFIPDPFSQQPGARLYRTGDRARCLANGNLEFLGRLDRQVKLRGFRIEPAEIESVLLEHPGVRQAAATVCHTPGGDKQLAAFIVLRPDGPQASADELKTFLKGKIPDYMVPSSIVVMNALPLTPAGKLDRRALPDPELPPPVHPPAAARVQTEELMAGIWSGLLGRTDIELSDNFFELGGHSLLATQVVSRTREVFGVEVPLKSLFEHSTLAAFTREVDLLARRGRPTIPPITKQPGAADYPLSFAQQRLWILNQIEPNEPMYIVSEAVRLSGRLDGAALEQSLDEIIQRHEVLRSTVESRDGQPVQRVRPHSNFHLRVEDLAGYAPPEREARLTEAIAEQTRQPFDFAKGLLIRAVLIRLAEHDHVLVFAAHHIAFDGWSVGIMIHELNCLYQSYRLNQPSPLPAPPIQYADYAAWQRRIVSESALKSQMEFWKKRLSGVPPLLELPTDWPRPVIQSYDGRNVSFRIEPALLTKLERLGGGNGATLFMTLLACFSTLLHRYCGSEDIVVGTPVANRNRTEIENLIGCFLNILVLRLDLSRDPTFRELLKRVRKTTLDAFVNQDVPFEKLVEELQPQRNRSHSPVFQVMFVLQNTPTRPLTLSGIASNPIPSVAITFQYDMVVMLMADETGSGMNMIVNYNTALFTPATVERMAGHYRRILEAAADTPDLRVSRISLLTRAERQTLLVERNATDAGQPTEQCVHRRFEEQVAQRPGAVAVRCGDITLTYEQLNVRANCLARRLLDFGIAPESRVAICLTRTADMAAAILAVYKAGGAYVPIDPDQPDERIAYIIRDSQSGVVLTSPALSARLRALAPQSTDIRIIHDLFAGSGTTGGNPDSGAQANHLAYVIYTSGSTGRPKGVMVQHASLSNLISAYIGKFGLGAHSRVYQFFSFCFDPSCIEIAAALSAGAQLVMATEGDRVSGESLAQALNKHAITFTQLPPSLLMTMSRADLPALETLVAGGEVCPAELAETWGARRKFYNVYGPTEATVSTTSALWTQPCRAMPIGIPFDNVRTYVLDRHLEPAPIGVPGELFIGGAGVARGYNNAPELTAERFVPDPFSGTPGARMYRTGDIVKMLDDGNLGYIGRTDHQVKIRGFRIELGEIEAALASHPSVRQSAAVVHVDKQGEKRIIAYVAGQHTAAITPPGMTAHLRNHVPDYMLPSAIVVMDALPLTAGGKVDRKALPSSLFADTRGFVAPRDCVEEILADIWAEVLGVERVGADDNFFDLGGHSLLAARVASRVRDALKLEGSILPLLFNEPTLAGFAGAIRSLESSPGQIETVARLRKEIREMSPEAKQALLSKMKR